MKKTTLIPHLALTVSLLGLFSLAPAAMAQDATGQNTAPQNPPAPASGTSQQLNQILNETETSAPNREGQSLPTVPPGTRPGPINDQQSIEQILNNTVNSNPNKEGTEMGVPPLPST